MNTILMVLTVLPGDLHEFHHFLHSGGSGDPPDPVVAYFITSLILVCVTSAGILVVGGPLLAYCTRRIRDAFWIVPLANVVLYEILAMLRTYPGGSAARFRQPGLPYTIGELVLLLVLGLLIALLIAIVRLVVRKVRSVLGSGAAEVRAEQEQDSVRRSRQVPNG